MSPIARTRCVTTWWRFNHTWHLFQSKWCIRSFIEWCSGRQLSHIYRGKATTLWHNFWMFWFFFGFGSKRMEWCAWRTRRHGDLHACAVCLIRLRLFLSSVYTNVTCVRRGISHAGKCTLRIDFYGNRFGNVLWHNNAEEWWYWNWYFKWTIVESWVWESVTACTPLCTNRIHYIGGGPFSLQSPSDFMLMHFVPRSQNVRIDEYARSGGRRVSFNVMHSSICECDVEWVRSVNDLHCLPGRIFGYKV